MNLTSKRGVKALLRKYHTCPSKKFGQNFLIDDNVIKKVIRAVNLQPKDTVLEIGPGIGALTQELAKKVYPVKSAKGGAKQFNGAGKITAIEKDPKMVEILKEVLKESKNVKIIQGDILKNQESRIKNQEYKIVANLPFYITTPVIRKFLEIKNQPELMVLITQKEVAQRICANPPKMNLLAVSVQFYAKAKIISGISKKSFWPQPKVDSAIIRVVPKAAFGNSQRQPLGKLAQLNSTRINPKLFFRIVKAGFSQSRKQLANNLAKGLALSSSNGLALSSSNGLALSLPNGLKLNKQKINELLLKNNIKPSRRAETLKIRDWFNLTESYELLIADC